MLHHDDLADPPAKDDRADILMPARDVRRAFSRSDMTIRRWVEKQLLPEPVYINGQRYWWKSAVRRLQQAESETQKTVDAALGERLRLAREVAA